MKLPESNEYYFEIKPKLAFNLNLKELFEYKELFYFFTLRDVKVRYKQTELGFLWAVLQPLIMMAIFTFFSGKTMNVPPDDLDYPIFAFSSLILWTVLASGITNAGTVSSLVPRLGIILTKH